MSCLDLHFWISPEAFQRLRGIAKEFGRVAYLHEVIEEVLRESAAAHGREWQGVGRHASHTRWRTLSGDGGEYPLNHAVLGGRQV